MEITLYLFHMKKTTIYHKFLYNKNPQVSTSQPDEKAKDPAAQNLEKPNSTAPDSSGDNCHQPEQSGDAKSANICNGEVTDSKQTDKEEDNITSSNGDKTPVKGKGKGKLSSSSTGRWS